MVKNLTEGKPLKLLFCFALPMVAGNLFQQLYNMVDTAVVGKFVGEDAVAAVGSSFPIVFLSVAVASGLSMGCNVVVSQLFGAGRIHEMKSTISTAILSLGVLGLVIMALGTILAGPLLRLLGTDPDIMTDSRTYLQIYFGGAVFLFLYNTLNGIYNAQGDSRTPLIFLMISSLTNIVLDIVLVVVLRMEVRGAAIATVFSQLVSAILVVFALMRTTDSYKLIIRKIRLNLFMVKRIIKIGLPAGLQSVMYALSNIIIQSSVNALGTDTIAAWTAYSKIDSVYWMIISALGISITTFVGQNYGAGKMTRVKRGVNVCLGITALITFLLCTVLYLFGGYVYLLFTTDAAVIAKGMEILYFLVPTFILYICIEIFSGALRGVGDCWIPMIMTALGVCTLRVVWIIIAVPIRPSIITVIR